ncbi:hypothetical protein GAW91_000173 [Vibrio fluvialis]|nr:hypothetical protein [Vibrio fluvialis]
MSKTDQKLRELAKRHAEISSDIKAGKDRVAIELSNCNGGDFEVEDIHVYGTCLNHAYNMTARLNQDSDFYGGHEDYDDILLDYGCRHCIQARKLKKNISKLRSERGRIHSAITQIGKTL